MKLVVFGLTVSSSWGNGHATLWRGLCGALARRGHQVVFFERDVPYYAEHRDLNELPHGRLILYADWNFARRAVERELADADAAMVTSYCADSIAATELVCESAALKCFYDLDTPVTLSRLRAGEPIAYIGERGLSDFDLVLSYTGGAALNELKSQLGARQVEPLYGHVDPAVHRPGPVLAHYRADLSYLGTYAEDRQTTLQLLFIAAAQRRPAQRFLIGGSGYPQHFPWVENIYFVRHVPPPDHSAFFSSSRLTLNATRGAMAEMGYCPSGRLFEAAACGVPILGDWWEGLDQFFAPNTEILVAHSTADAVAALDIDDAELAAIAGRARKRTLAQHTADHRAAELEVLLQRRPAASLQPIAGAGLEA